MRLDLLDGMGMTQEEYSHMTYFMDCYLMEIQHQYTAKPDVSIGFVTYLKDTLTKELEEFRDGI